MPRSNSAQAMQMGPQKRGESVQAREYRPIYDLKVISLNIEVISRDTFNQNAHARARDTFNQNAHARARDTFNQNARTRARDTF